LPASCLSLPSLAGKARPQVFFLWEAVIEKRRSSAHLVHQVLQDLLLTLERPQALLRAHGSSQFIVNAGTQ